MGSEGSGLHRKCGIAALRQSLCHLWELLVRESPIEKAAINGELCPATKSLTLLPRTWEDSGRPKSRFS